MIIKAIVYEIFEVYALQLKDSGHETILNLGDGIGNEPWTGFLYSFGSQDPC